MSFNGGNIGGGNITSANAVFMLTASAVFNTASMKLENWSSERFLEAENQTITEIKMSNDGRMNAGYVPRSTSMTLTLSAASNSIPIFDAIVAAQQQSQTPIELNAEVSVPAIGRKFTMTRGFIVDASVIPTLGEVQEDRTYHIQWNSVDGVAL